MFIYILLVHFLADFALQTHDQATLKGTSNKWLFYHVAVYSAIWFIACIATHQFTMINCVIFTGITFICHFITDYFTSRIGKPFWAVKNMHDGFVVVGFDQMLHYIQLYYTFKLLI